MKKGKVIVTGGCGFVGREVVRQLLEKGYQVVVMDDFSNSTSLQESSSLQVIDLDLSKTLGNLEIFSGADYCIHLAARVGGIKYMNAFQSQILKDNILIDANIISAASQVNLKIVYASTVIVYDQLKDPPFKEEQVIMPPKSNYAFSKLVGERLCQVFGKDRNLKYTIARISNLYGINQNKIEESKLHVIPDLVRKISHGGTLKLINGGNQRRVFVHVSDLANALILMMESNRADGEIFNIGSDDRYKIVDIAEMIWQYLNRNQPFSFESIDLNGEDLIDSSTDTSKIRGVLGWNPKKNLKEALTEIVKQYQI